LAADSFEPAVLHAQVILDRAGISPGVIDGRRGSTLESALRTYQLLHRLKVTGAFDDATNARLSADQAPALIRVTITKSDAAGPFRRIPADYADQAKLPAMGYEDLLERLAEKYHTTRWTIGALNPGAKALGEGVSLIVPNVATDDHDYVERLPQAWRETLAQLNVAATQPQAARITVDESRNVVRAFDANGKLIAQFPASMGSSCDPLPVGTWKILDAASNPKFNYNASRFWTTSEMGAKAALPPGPNSPVGVVWFDLSKPHYGIHGTPDPNRVGQSQDQGCIRLTNWDAARLSLMVQPGTPTVFQK
jgi:lipoprotein-anchoring transpeptidase ErfK/SrfK